MPASEASKKKKTIAMASPPKLELNQLLNEEAGLVR
jgi:hypothetical protein